MKFRQHMPNFLDGFERLTGDVATLAELNADPLGKRWSEWPGFARWAKGTTPGHTATLIAEFVDHWAVVAYIDDEPLPELPEWIAPGSTEGREG